MRLYKQRRSVNHDGKARNDHVGRFNYQSTCVNDKIG